MRLVTDLLHEGRPVPFILLTEDADEATVAEIIGSGTWNCLAKSRLDGATLLRTIHNTVALHRLQLEQQNAEESLRKLSRAVEQSADTVIITDGKGIIESVNPEFEALTGYSAEEIRGHTPQVLKSGEQSQEFYHELWKTFPEAKFFGGFWSIARRTENSSTSKRPSVR